MVPVQRNHELQHLVFVVADEARKSIRTAVRGHLIAAEIGTP